MKKQTIEAVLLSGGGALALLSFAASIFNFFPETIAGLLMGAGVLVALLGFLIIARRHSLPWCRTRRSKSP